MQDIVSKIKNIKKERNKDKLSTIAYDTIKSAIVNFDFEPGNQLSENLLADALEMSRTPVREALKKLVQENLIKMYNGGIIVSDVSIKDLNEIFIARKSLEIEAIKSSCDNFSNEEIDSLRNQWQEILNEVQKNDNVEWKLISNKDHNLHSNIINKSKNSYIISLYNNISPQINRYQLLSAIANNNITDTINQHLEIIDLIGKNKKNLLIEKMSVHIIEAISNISKGMLDDRIAVN